MLKMIGYLILGILLVLLGMYLGGVRDIIEKSDLITKHPAIFVGVGAAIAALIGVVISQLWQTVNLKLQHSNAIILKNIELDENKNQKRYEEFEKDRKDFWVSLLKLRRLSKLNFECSETIASNFIQSFAYEYFSKDSYQSTLNRLHEEFLEMKEKNYKYTEEIETLVHNINYLHNIKKIGDEDVFSAFLEAHYQLMTLEKEPFWRVKNIEEMNLDVSNKDLSLVELIEKYEKEPKKAIKEVQDFFYANENILGYSYAYDALLASIENSKPI